MRALVIHQPEPEANRAIAEAVARGLEATGQMRSVDARVVDARDGLPDDWRDDLCLLVLGGDSRAGAVFGAADLTGIRTVVFGMRMPGLFARNAASGLFRMASKAGAHLLEGPQDFLIDRDGRLVVHELDHAFEWGRVLAASVPVPMAAGRRC